MSIPSLLGPITDNSSFMIVSIQNGTPYFLNGSSIQNKLEYYWDNNDNPGNFPVFSIKSSENGFIITDTVNKGDLGINTNNIIVNLEQSTEIDISQSVYQDWWPPNILLSQAIYTISSLENVIANIYSDSSITSTIPANNIIILPIYWYSNCNNDGTYDLISTAPSSLLNWFCNVDPSLSVCESISILESGWTNLSDCVVGQNYSYCLKGDNCGTEDCKGPCSLIYYDCLYRDNEYQCVFDPEKYFRDTKWWTSPIFISIMVVLGIIILVFIGLLVFFVYHHHKKLTLENQ